jgi:hypothetical protein
MVSVRDTCADCLDETGTLSIREDLFGYIWGPIDRQLRVRQHIDRIRGNSINICVFFVGHEPGFNGSFTEAQAIHTQRSIDLMREIYAQVPLGVRRIFWRHINEEDAAPYLSVDAGGATDLTTAYSGPNDGIDVFWVQTVSDAGGWSNSLGPCDKDSFLLGRTGAVLRASTGIGDFTGILLAHEVGHYLTLVHWTTMTNLMGADTDNDGIGELNNTSRNLTNSQKDDILDSCWVRGPC